SLHPHWLSILLSFGLVLAASGAEPRKAFDVPAGIATETLKRFAQQAGQQVVYPANDVQGVRTNEVKGELTAQEGIDTLLAGTRLRAVFDHLSGAFAVSR